MKLRTIIAMAITLSGCATMTHGAKQRVMVTTPGAPKAKCTLSSQTIGRVSFTTPEAFLIPRSSEIIEISCSRKCFHDETKTFSPVINGEDLASNGFTGGGPGLAIDVATKKAYQYPYDFVIQMKANGRCRPNGKGFLDGNLKDFDNQIQDFSFDEAPKPLPEASAEDLKNITVPVVPDKSMNK